MKNTILFLLGLFSLFLLSGCGGDKPYSPILSGTTPDFTISIQPISQIPVLTTTGSTGVKREPASNQASFTVTLTSNNGFTGSVNLAATSDQNSNLFTTSFNPQPVVLSGSGSQTSQFTVTLTIAGEDVRSRTQSTFSWTISAGSGTITHTAAVHPTVEVESAAAPTFTVSVQEPSPTPVLFTQPIQSAGVRGFIPPPVTIPVLVSPVNGFTGTVTLAATSQQSGNILSTSFSTATVTLNGVHSQTVSLAIRNQESDAAPETYTYAVSGTSGALSVRAPSLATVIVDLPFTISVTPNPATIPAEAGQVGTWTVTVTGQGGYTGTVDLESINSSPTNFTLGFSSSSVALTAAQPKQSVTFNATLLDPVNDGDGGTFSFQLKGTSLIYSAAATANLNVTAF